MNILNIRIVELDKPDNIDLSLLIKDDSNCISQILPNIPSESVIRQACYFYFNFKGPIKVKNKRILFLLLLSQFEQIKDALNYVREEKQKANKLYLIECCKGNNKDVNFLPYRISSNEERLVLTKNSLLLVDRL